MGRIVERLRAVPPGQAALAVAVIALVTALVYFGGREAGVAERSEAGTVVVQDQRGEAAQQGDDEEADGEGDAGPLTLTLSAAEICETTPAQGYSGAAMVWNEETQDWGVKSYKTGYDDVGETAVTWSVGGGTAPYTLVIDGETRDAEQTYVGPNGTASVSCAMQLGETFITDDGSRRYRTEPEVDSGLKTIRATVTDGAGATAEASVDVYVILELPGSRSILKRGKTYRVFGRLITAPTTHDVRVGSVQEADCPDPPTPTTRCGSSFRLQLVDTGARISLFMTDDAEGVREYATNGAWGPAVIENEMIEAAFDALTDSLDRRPSVEQAGS